MSGGAGDRLRAGAARNREALGKGGAEFRAAEDARQGMLRGINARADRNAHQNFIQTMLLAVVLALITRTPATGRIMPAGTLG